MGATAERAGVMALVDAGNWIFMPQTWSVAQGPAEMHANAAGARATEPVCRAAAMVGWGPRGSEPRRCRRWRIWRWGWRC